MVNSLHEITPLRGGKTERVHCARLLKYRDSLLVKQIPQDMFDLAERTESRYEVIENITDLGQDHDGLFFQVQWEGLPDKRDYTWQPAKEVYADVPDLVSAFLASLKKNKKTSRHRQAPSKHFCLWPKSPPRPFVLMGAVRPTGALRRRRLYNGHNTAQSYHPIFLSHSNVQSHPSVCLSI